MKTKIAIVLAALLVIFFLGSKMVERVDENGNPVVDAITDNTEAVASVITEDIVVGTGDAAQIGDTVKMNYVGTFEDGSEFDSNLDKDNPFSFTIGAGQVIAGWEQGIPGMQVGGKRKLTIPSELGYGSEDYAGIPGNSTLTFEVELLDITR